MRFLIRYKKNATVEAFYLQNPVLFCFSCCRTISRVLKQERKMKLSLSRKIIFLNLILSSVGIHAAPLATNVLMCPQNISGTFTVYSSPGFVQNGVTWNYGPFNANTPGTITLNHVNTNNDLDGMTPGIVMGPAVICKGNVHGIPFVFMTDPVPAKYDNVPNFHANPIGRVYWQYFDK